MSTLSDYGLARVAAVTVPVHLGDPAANAEEIASAAATCAEQGCVVAVFPELSLSGYSLGDLFTQQHLLRAVQDALNQLAAATAELATILVVGAPLMFQGALYNCAVYMQRGEILGVTPKRYLPNYAEFYEQRYFAAGDGETYQYVLPGSKGAPVPFGPVQLRASDLPGFQLAAEICEDLWLPVAPSAEAALQGATIIANLSASPVTVGRERRRELLAQAQSATTLGAYVYASAGFGESSNDLAWDGQGMIFELGTKLAESPRFELGPTITVADIDLEAITHQRVHQGTFHANVRASEPGSVAIVDVEIGETEAGPLRREVVQFPFVPADIAERDSDCAEAFSIQANALARRVTSIGQPKLVIGVSGGLDSTHALLVAAQTMDMLGRPRSDILAYTMPGFGTSDKTRKNAEKLSHLIGATFHELDIVPTAQAMLETMGHPAGTGAAQYDVTFENVQAGLRTDYLFRLANHEGGIVVGTGDLSELALGWCTYGVGDQMSHYAVNAGIPKTLIQHLIRWAAQQPQFSGDLAEVLTQIVSTEISPELIPAGDGQAIQSTEAKIGPYELQDFTLYYLLQHGFSPRKIFFLQQHAWAEKYSDAELIDWLELFHRRFFANQFKRTAIPNGPKVVGGGSLSPRGDWRMPSDALADSWLREIKQLRSEVTS